MINKKRFSFLILLLTCMILFACEKEIVLVEPETYETKRNGIVSKITAPTVNFDKFLESDDKKETSTIIEEKETTVLSTNEINETDELAETSVVEIEDNSSKTNDIETGASSETIKSVDLSLVVDEDDRVFHGNINIDTTLWEYGRTPCDWVYIEPGIQLVSNYKPNTSKLYSVKSKISSGLKGCFIPIFSRTDTMSNEYDGRFYCFEDYSKEKPEKMFFNTTLNGVMYKGLKVADILKMMPGVTEINNSIYQVNGQYINVIYATDLDKILNGN